ncbi:MAG: hypothetical protein DRI46_10900 [Chloroflexi bacterium]|nr:MAG: hypothetical protein DRI46_10900 [Chloroflexota bacterium]
MAIYLPNADAILDGYTLSYKAELLSATFGHGYSQVADNGIDNAAYSTSLTMKGLTSSKKDQVLAFFKSVGSAKPFLIPRLDDVDLIVLLEPNSYKEQVSKLGVYTISFKVVEHKFVGEIPE